MIKMEIKSIVNLFGMNCTDTYIEEFNDDENVFSRVLKHHQRMYRTFPNCKFKLVEAKEIR